MMRLAGAILLAAGPSALGIGAVHRLAGRVRDLSGLIMGLESLKREIQSSMDRLEHAMAVAADGTGGIPRQFYAFCHNELLQLNNRTFNEIWQAALETIPLRIKACDRQELRALGLILGRYDTDSQITALEGTMKRLEVRLTEAKEQRNSLGKVYGAVGISAGLLLAIILI